MNNSYQAIYLAPHLDDVVLSCGGQICEESQRGRRALIVTIMAGDPPARLSAYAERLHSRWQLAQQATVARRREDLEACAMIGAAALHWSIPDCIYRVDPANGTPLYLSDTDIFGSVQQVDYSLIEAIAQQLALLPSCNHIFAPLTAGHHVDHQITRWAAEQVFGSRLEFYEDFPYIQTPGSLDFLHADDSNSQNWVSKTLAVSDEALHTKVEAILTYRSQLSTFFEDRSDLEQQVFGYARQVGGERIWQKTVSTATANG